MRFLPNDFDPPGSYRSDNLYIRPLVAGDVELDYDAILSSQDMLRDWGWPFDFKAYTRDADLLAIMSDREKHMRSESFCFAIMNPEDSYCFGSVYLQPLIPELIQAKTCEQTEANPTEYGAEIFFWVRESLICLTSTILSH